MDLAQKRKETYLEERHNREVGLLNGIPLFYAFPKLGSIIKTIPRGYPIMLTANSGIGKTQFWMGMFIYNIYYIKKFHPEVNLNVKLVIALLEDSKEMFIDRLYSMLFWNLYGIIVDADTLHSRNEVPLEDSVIDKLSEVEQEVNFILDLCVINDSTYHPTGVYMWAKTLAHEMGVFHTKKMKFTDDNGEVEERDVFSHYTPNDPSLQVLMIVDNLNNLAQEARDKYLLSERETINMWTRNYCRLNVTKKWNWSVINILQQVSSSEEQQYTFKGESIIGKLKPSLADLGGSKECQRDQSKYFVISIIIIIFVL